MTPSHVADWYSTFVHRKVSKLPSPLYKTFSVCQNLSAQTPYIIQSQKQTNLLPYLVNLLILLSSILTICLHFPLHIQLFICMTFLHYLKSTFL